MKKFLIIVLLEIFLSTTIGYIYNGTSKSENKRFSTRNPLGYDFTSSNIKPSDDLVASAVLNLGINIFKHTAAESNEKMQVISPLSIAGATSLIELGANGKTLKELMGIHGETESYYNFA